MLRLVALATLATAATNPCGRDVAWIATTNATASLNATLFAPSARGDAPSAAALRLGVWRETSNATACWAARLRAELALRGATVRQDLARHFAAATAPGALRGTGPANPFATARASWTSRRGDEAARRTSRLDRRDRATIYAVLDAYLPRVGVNGMFEAWCELKRSIARPAGCEGADCASESSFRENHVFAALDAAERVAADRRADPDCAFVFGSGAFHAHGLAWGGMLSAARVAGGDARRTARFIEGACAFLDETTNAYHACVHGVGHGALQVFRPRRPEAGAWRGFFDGPLQVCAALAGGAWFRLKCATGVFHEASVDATAPGFDGTDGLLETFAPCGGLPDVVAGAASTCLWAKLKPKAKRPENQTLFANEGATDPCLRCEASGPCDRSFLPACAYAEASVHAAARGAAGIDHPHYPAEVCAAWDPKQHRRAFLACVVGAHNAQPDGRVAPFTKGRGADEGALDFDDRLAAFRAARPPRRGRGGQRPSCAGLDDEAARVCAAAAAAAGSLEAPELFDIVAAFERDARGAY